MNQQLFVLKSLEDWDQVVAVVLEQIKSPMILALSGPLGAGKTTFVQYLARALGVKGEPRSPTFSLLRTHVLPEMSHGVQRVVHIDAYRLDKPSDLYALDLENELAESGTIVALEWPEQVGEALVKYGVPILKIEIVPNDKNTREVRLS